MARMTEYPIFPKTYDLLRWIIERSVDFPKSQRFVMAKRLQDTVLDVHELLIAARKAPLAQRRELLLQADVRLETLRLHLRLCHELKLLAPKQYTFASQQVVEIGKLLGNWRKKTDGSNTG